MITRERTEKPFGFGKPFEMYSSLVILILYTSHGPIMHDMSYSTMQLLSVSLTRIDCNRKTDVHS